MSIQLTFNYDVICPFAYMAFLKLPTMLQQLKVEYPHRSIEVVCGIYDLTGAPQGKNNSALAVMSAARKSVLYLDVARLVDRCGLTGGDQPFVYKGPPTIRSLNALRLLYAMKDQSNCIQLSKVLYRAYWHECLDISSTDVLLGLAKRIGAIPSDAKWDSLITSREKELLENATKECVNRGGPGVPVFFIQDLQTGESKLYWGQDRLLFVERDLHRLLRNGQQLPRSLYDRWLNPGPSRYTKPPALTLDFYFDIASPWSYLGWTQLQTVVRQSGVNVHIELVPILVGALFNSIGTASVPMETLSDARKVYNLQDLHDWTQWWCEVGDRLVRFQFNSNFPIRSVLANRLVLASKCDPLLIDVLFEAAWCNDQNITNEANLVNLIETQLKQHYDADRLKTLFVEARSERIKAKLRHNTDAAIKMGLCGVPSYVLNNDPETIVFGQDRFEILIDLLRGWRVSHATQFPPTSPQNKL